MKQNPREALDEYYAEAASWNRDRVGAMQKSHRIAWAIAGTAGALALLQAIALALVLPLKTVVPYTLMVDKTTGFVQALKPLDRATIAPDSALTQSFLVQYVIAREGFDSAVLNANYRKVALFSADKARSSYLATMQVSNPASPLIVYPRGTIIEVRVKSVSPLGPSAALIRFDTIRNDPRGQAGSPHPWVALVRYRYSTAPMSLEDRFVNPLGFQIISYRKDPETLPLPAPTTVEQVSTSSTTVSHYYGNTLAPAPPQPGVSR